MKSNIIAQNHEITLHTEAQAIGGVYTNPADYSILGFLTVANTNNLKANLSSYFQFDEQDDVFSSSVGTETMTRGTGFTQAALPLPERENFPTADADQDWELISAAFSGFQNAEWKIPASSNFTVGLRVRFASLAASQTLLENDDVTIRFNQVTGKIHVIWWDDSTELLSGVIDIDAQDMFLAVTWDGTTAKFYINGALVDSNTPADDSSEASGCYLGSKSDDTEQVNGRLSSLARWSRVLREDEIAAIAGGVAYGQFREVGTLTLTLNNYDPATRESIEQATSTFDGGTTDINGLHRITHMRTSDDVVGKDVNWTIESSLEEVQATISFSFAFC